MPRKNPCKGHDKRKARLSRRIGGFESIHSSLPKSAFHKPGSQNRKKS